MRSSFLTDLILASFKGWKTLLKAGLLKETLTTTISSKLTVGKTNYLEKIMPATTGPESIGSKQPRTLPDIGEALKLGVKGYQGTAYESYTCYDSSGDSSSSSVCYRPVRVYEQVKWQQYQSRRAIDVFINGKNWTRVHW